MNTTTRLLTATLSVASLMVGQAPAVPAVKPGPAKASVAPPKPTAPAPSRIDEVIQLVQGGLSENVIVKMLQKTNKPVNLTGADMIKLKQAGVSENIMNVLMDPAAVPTGTAPAPMPAVVITGPKPAASPAVKVTAADYNTDLASVGCVPEPRKRILAITEFEYGTVKDQLQAIFGTNVDIGKGIMALLTKQLQQDGKYRIVERANLKTLLGEQDAGASNRVKPGTSAKIGKVIGADAYLMGTIVTFGRDDKKKGINTGGMIPRIGGMSVNLGKKTDKAVVAIAYRLVDTETTEVLDTAQEKGESTRQSNSFAIAGIGGGGGGAVGTDMTSSNFAQTIIGEATIACVKALSDKMSAQQERVKMRRIEVEGRVAELTGKSIYITTGSNDGVNRCDKFEVSRIVRELKDPQTKEVLDLVMEKVGEMVVTEVRDRMAIGVYQGSAPPEVNMAVRKIIPSGDHP